MNLFCFPGSSVGEESACCTGDPGSIPGLGRCVGEGIGHPRQYFWASLVAQLVKNPPAVQETWVQNPWVGKIHWRREQLPTPVFWPGEFRGLCSRWGHKEWDTTKQLSLHSTAAIRIFRSPLYFLFFNSCTPGDITVFYV